MSIKRSDALDTGSDNNNFTTVQPQRAENLISKLGQVIPDDTASTTIKDFYLASFTVLASNLHRMINQL